MWLSFDDGANWSKFQMNLPPVPIADLAIKNDNLIAATHGRSFWMIDDLTPLHQLTKRTALKKLFSLSLCQVTGCQEVADGAGPTESSKARIIRVV
ncbi:MAG: hypothetical protein U5K54_11065 [Cytophagales bacterium]|nr:hypothetical protein [Cytophagales bacterium]